METKVVILNGKRFIVGKSKIKSTKCNIDKISNISNKEKMPSKEEIMKQKKENKKTIMSLPNRRKTKRTSRNQSKEKKK